MSEASDRAARLAQRQATHEAPAVGPDGWVGPWSVATAYKAGMRVEDFGSAYVAMSDVAAGGTRPRLNNKWLLFGKAGGRIVRSTYAGVDLALVNNTLVDVPGVQIVVPAGAPDVVLRAAGQLQAGISVNNGWARMVLILWDVTNNVLLKQAWVQGMQPVSGGNVAGPAFIEEFLAATAVNRTFKLTTFANLSNATPKLMGPGTGSSSLTPFLEAVAA